jgi:hypothetical protein
MAARLLAEGQKDHLYDHNPVYFHIVRDPAWEDTAR